VTACLGEINLLAVTSAAPGEKAWGLWLPLPFKTKWQTHGMVVVGREHHDSYVDVFTEIGRTEDWAGVPEPAALYVSLNPKSSVKQRICR